MRKPRRGFHRIIPKRGKQGSDRQSVADQWRRYYRGLFLAFAKRTRPGEDMAEFALAVTTDDEFRTTMESLVDHRSALPSDEAAVTYLFEIADSISSGSDHYAEEDLRLACEVAAKSVPAVCLRVVRSIVSQLTDRETDSSERFAPARLPDVARELASLFSLSETEVRVLVGVYALTEFDPLEGIVRAASDRIAVAAFAAAAGVESRTFVEITSPGERLDRLGLITYRGGRDELIDVTPSRPVLFSFRTDTLDDLYAGLFVDTPKARYGAADYPITTDEIGTCLASLRGGYPVLVSGEPGVGKTEFARSLAAHAGLQPYTLSASIRGQASGDEGSDAQMRARFGAVRMAAHLLTPATDVLIVDEADAILQSATGLFGIAGFGAGSYDKAELNDLLESLPTPSIWIANEHEMVPTSALRRFGHVVAFPRPNVEMRATMLQEHLGETAGDVAWARDLASQYDITPAAVDRTARILSAELEAGTVPAAEARSRVEGYLRRAADGPMRHEVRRLPAVSPSFDPRFCNTSEPSERVERLALHRVAKGTGLRLLFDGPPGGGKTQYALWLTKRIGRDAMLMRPSDLLSMYVGESEKRIARAFDGAARSGAVLIIDEAEALLRDRRNAQHSWEQTQAAEFLQRIQDYEGLLIACTNLPDAIDPALRRRFHRHVTFGFVAGERLRRALDHLFPKVTFDDDCVRELTAGPPLMMSDLANAAEMIDIESEIEGIGAGSEATAEAGEGGVSPKEVVREILASASARDRSRRIGF